VKLAFIGFGSNLGPRQRNCERGLELLLERRIFSALKVSSLWLTEPWGYLEQPLFLNGAFVGLTDLGPRQLLSALKEVEREVGRKEGPRWGPRVLDLDLLLYEEEVLEEEDLKVPHPHMHERAFVLVPLVEVAPWAYHPLKGKTALELLKELGEPKGIYYYGRLYQGCPLSSSP